MVSTYRGLKKYYENLTYTFYHTNSTVNLSQMSAMRLLAIKVPVPPLSAHTNIPLATDLKEIPLKFLTT